MNVGDLVRLTNGRHGETSLVVEMHPIGDDACWLRVVVLYPNGHVDWEYDIDLEVVSE